MASYFNRFVATLLVAGALLSGTLSAAVAQSGAFISFAGPGAIVLNSGDYPPPGTSVSVNDQGLLIIRDAGSLQMTGGTVFSLTDLGSVIFEDASLSVVNGTFLQDGNGYMRVSEGSTLTNNGVFAQSSGTALVTSDSTFNGSGSVVMTGGTMTIDGSMIQTGVTVNGGRLEGGGTIQSNVANSGGTVGPGNSPGTLTVDGNYTQGAGGTLEIEIASLLSFDVLDISGTAALDGILDLTVDAGYAAAAQDGDMFTIVEWDSFSGAFDTVNGLTFGDGKFFTLDYGATGLTLTVGSESVVAVPAPGAIALFGLGLAGIGFARRRRCPRIAPSFPRKRDSSL